MCSSECHCLSIVWKNHSVNRLSCCTACWLSSCNLRFSSVSFLTATSRLLRRLVSRITRSDSCETWHCSSGNAQAGSLELFILFTLLLLHTLAAPEFEIGEFEFETVLYRNWFTVMGSLLVNALSSSYMLSWCPFI